MTLQPNSLRGQLLSLCLLLLSVIFVWFCLLAPMAGSLRSKQDQIDQLETRYEKFSGLIARGQTIAADRASSVPNAFVSGSRTSAQTALQSEVRRIALLHKVNLRSISAQGLDEEASDTVAIKISAEADLEALVRLLYQLDTTGKAIWTRDLTLRAENRREEASIITRVQLTFTAEALWSAVEEG